jgi:hypothetical protein
MTPETLPPAAVQPSGMSEAARITGVFFEPKKAFADIAARPRWFVPLLLIILFAIGVAWVYSDKGVMRVVVAQRMATSPQTAQMTPDQRAAAIEQGAKFASFFGFAVPVIIPIMFLIMSVVLWGIASGILSAPIRFGQVFAIVCYAQLPGILMSIMIYIVLQIKNVADYNINNPLMFNPAAFMDPQTSSKFLYSVASSFDLFTFWIMLLIATGLKAASGKRLSFGGAFFAVALPWAAYVLVKSAVAGITG